MDDSRIAHLERENRRLRRFVVAALLASLLPWVTAALPSSPGTALFDGDGNARGGLRVTEDGAAVLALADAEGRERIRLATTAAGNTSLGFFDERGHPNVRLENVNGSSLNFYDRKGKLRAALGVTGYGPYSIEAFLDAVARWKAPGEKSPFAFADPASPEMDEIHRMFGAENGPVLRFFDTRGRPKLEARVDVDRPLIFLHDDEGRLGVVRPVWVRDADDVGAAGR